MYINLKNTNKKFTVNDTRNNIQQSHKPIMSMVQLAMNAQKYTYNYIHSQFFTGDAYKIALNWSL